MTGLSSRCYPHPARYLVPVCLALLTVISAAGTAAAQGRFDDLLRRVPTSANAIMVIDVEAVHQSPIAVKGRWKEQHEASYVSRPLILPPESDRMVLASQLNPNRGFEQAWELGVLHLTEALSMRSVARAEGGYVDSISGFQAAWTPSDAYFVDLGGQTMGVMYPAHRQAVARWARSGEQKTIPVSPYLQSAAAMVNSTVPIVLAFDLHDSAPLHRIREGLQELEQTKGDTAKQQAWEAVILGIQGVILKVQFGESARGTMQVDFAGNPEVFGKEAGPLVLRVLENAGAGIDDLQQWKASTTSRSILMEGPLSAAGMRRLFSLLELPSTKFSTQKDAAPAAEDDTDSLAEASLSYFKSVSTLLDDLREEFRTNRDARNSLAPVFMERYGRKIDRLPILNVDEDLLGWGAAVAETLRGVSVTSRTAGVQSGVRKSQVYGNYQYASDSNGYYYSRPTSSVKTQIRREEQATARKARFSNWKEIEDSTAQIRIAMTQKYGLEF